MLLPTARLARTAFGTLGALMLVTTIAASSVTGALDLAPALATLAMAIGVLVGLLPVLRNQPQTPLTWGTLIIMGSTLRFVVALVAAVIGHFAISPEVLPYWGTFLLAGTATIVVEVMILYPAFGQAMESPLSLTSEPASR